MKRMECPKNSVHFHSPNGWLQFGHQDGSFSLPTAPPYVAYGEHRFPWMGAV